VIHHARAFDRGRGTPSLRTLNDAPRIIALSFGDSIEIAFLPRNLHDSWPSQPCTRVKATGIGADIILVGIWPKATETAPALVRQFGR